MTKIAHYTLFAPAKINLGLRVLGRSPSGYHFLQTVFHTIAVADCLRIRVQPHAAARTTVSCSDPALPCGADNSAHRAVHLLRALGAPLGQVTVAIDKRIPIAGGLGGSSADAAAILRGLRHYLPASVSRQQLQTAALQLGADVPFLLSGGCAYALGRGERIDPMPSLHRRPLWLLISPFGCSTAAVFSALSASERAPASDPGRGVWRQTWRRDPASCLGNQLWPAACRVQPRLRQLSAWLTQQGVPWGLSGSGSTCYLLEPPRLAPPLGCRIIETHFLSRELLDDAAAYARATGDGPGDQTPASPQFPGRP